MQYNPRSCSSSSSTSGGSRKQSTTTTSTKKITWLVFGVFLAIGLHNAQKLIQDVWFVETDERLLLRQDDNHHYDQHQQQRDEKVVAESPPLPPTTTTTSQPATKIRQDEATAPPTAPRQQQQVEFVHIPKTGGTAIEYVASLANITWGLCHWKARPLAGPGCHNPDWLMYSLRKRLARRHPVESSWEIWHTPPSWLVNNDEDDYIASPYHNKTLFAVVRNPYERFISEYYCPYNGLNPVDWTKEDLGFVDPMGTLRSDALAIAAAEETRNNKMKQTTKRPETPESLHQFLVERLRYPVKWTAHYVPQSDYIFDESGRQLVQHVLKYDNLPGDFQSLMERYQLPVFLNATTTMTTTINQRITTDPLGSIRMTTKDLFPETILRINQVARRDFEKFGYAMMDPDVVSLQRRRRHQVQRIYYINLWHKADRRVFMESWLSQQPIPYQRINATMGDLNGNDCVASKQNPLRCRGIAGLVMTELDIIRHHNTSGLTIVFEDDFIVTKPLQEVVDATLRLVPSDWDVIRWDCWGIIPSSFDMLVPENPKVFRTVHRRTCEKSIINGNDGRPCWFAGGTHAMMWREESVSKLEQLWSQKPFNDIDLRLTSEVVKSYCVNNMGIGRMNTTAALDSSIPKLS